MSVQSDTAEKHYAWAQHKSNDRKSACDRPQQQNSPSYLIKKINQKLFIYHLLSLKPPSPNKKKPALSKTDRITYLSRNTIFIVIAGLLTIKGSKSNAIWKNFRLRTYKFKFILILQRRNVCLLCVISRTTKQI